MTSSTGSSAANLETDFKEYDSAKYNLQTTIEAMLDICNHIIARNAYEVPRTNADAFRLLCRKNILGADMEDTYTAMARFRNSPPGTLLAPDLNLL